MIKSQLRSSDSEDYQKLKAIKYPVRPISNAIFLNKKLNSFSPAIQATLKREISKQLNAYRQVRGDGNCFFRAFAFTCIASKKYQHVADIFPLIDKVKLDTCKPESIPPAFRPFYDDRRLKAVLKKRWDIDFDFFLRANRYNYKRALSRLFNENHYLDFIVILYFRAVCVWVLRTQQQYKQFLSSEADELTTYGCESEGVTINLCSNYFQMNIRILEVRASEVIPYDYMVQKNTYVRDGRVDLLYSDAHYDLIERNDDPLQEYEDEKVEEEYYSEIKYSYIAGTCIECQDNTEISEETGLCANCFNKSLENFTSFQKDTTVQGQCAQCSRKTKISQDLLMCEECIDRLQYASNPGSRVRESPPPSYDQGAYFKSEKCRECRQMKRFSEMGEGGVCRECVRKREDEEFSQLGGNSIISIGMNKLESKISKDKREQQEAEKKVTQAMIRSKTMYAFTCSQCQKQIRVASEEELNHSGPVCPDCLLKKRSQIKSNGPNIQQSGSEIRTSGFGSKLGKASCIRCGKKPDTFPLQSNGMCGKCNRK